MAVSGLHAVILSLFIFNLLFFLKAKFNILRISITILFLWCFAFITGLTPSVLRATMMFSFVQAGNLMHRKPDGINSVLASAFILILIKPSVIFDAGFLLSYSAVIFIISFYTKFSLLLNPPYTVTRWIWQSTAVTIVAQTGTLALSVMLFNRFPVWFILTNIIIVPMSSLALIIGCLIPIFYPLAAISGFTGFILDKLTGLIEFITEKAAGLPFAGITGIGLSVPECILLLCVLYMIMNTILSNRGKSIRSLLFLVVILAITSTIFSIRIKTSGELIVYNLNGRAALGIRTGKMLNIYSDSLISDPVINRHRSAAGLRIKYHPLHEGCIFLNAGHKQILFCSSSAKQDYSITGFKNEDIIIITATQVTNFRNQYPPEIHDIRKEGAFIFRL